jgi:hypothetical protein
MGSILVRWLRELDRIIRGEATRPQALREGGGIDIAPGSVSVIIMALGLVYGLCMGSFALFKEGGPNFIQAVASAVKVPLLFFLTLLVTFPSLYVFNALVGSRLSLGSVLRLLIAGLAVMGALLASFGPIVAFFSASTTSYPFMKLLNVIVFTVAGILGLRYLLTTLHRLTVAMAPPPDSEKMPRPVTVPPDVRTEATPMDMPPIFRDAPPNAAQPPAPVPPAPRSPGALDVTGETMGRDVTTVFRIWVVVFGLVGAQMAWVLRPFIGAPDIAFTWFRPRESNFFESVFRTLGNLLGIG